MRWNSSPYNTYLTILPKWRSIAHLILLFWPYFQTRFNSSPYTTSLNIGLLPNEAQQFTLYYFSKYTLERGPAVHPILFLTILSIEAQQITYTTCLTMFQNEAQQFTLYCLSDHIPKWGPTGHPILLFSLYFQTRPNSSAPTTFLSRLPNEAQQFTLYLYTTCLTILRNEVQQSTLNYFSDHTPKWCPTLHPITLFWAYS